MAALSYHSNSGAFQPPPQLTFDTNIDSFSFPPMELNEFLGAAWNNTIDSVVFDTAAAGGFFSDNYSCFPSYEIAPYKDFNFSFNSLAAAENYLLHQDCEASHYLKRHKGCDYEQPYSEFKPPGFSDRRIVQNPNFPNMEIAAQPQPVLPDFATTPPGYSRGTCESTPLKKEPGSLSAQSIAARQRRRKITENTQALGKMVPGGQKMNTAEMLQSAYKYIKFLQAQVGILEFMNSYSYSQEEDEQKFPLSVDEQLHDLLQSPLIQEKLYSTENCLVTQKFVQELSSSDHRIVESNPALLPVVVKLEHSCSR